MNVPFAIPCIGDEEVAAAGEAMRTGWLSSGPKVAEFEAAMGAYLQVGDAVATGSCTVAMAAALGAVGVGPGDAVFVPDITFPATANVVRHHGAEVVLVDVLPGSLTMDPDDLERRIALAHLARLKPKVVMPVDLAGHPCDYDRIASIAQHFGLAVVVDAAHSLGARYKAITVGQDPGYAELDWLTCFSFYATKNLTTGEGGMVTGSPQLMADVRAWAMHGIDRRAWDRHRGGSWYFDVTVPGFKGNMTDPAAAVGLVQLRAFPAAQHRRREIAAQYDAAFEGLALLPVVPNPGQHAWHVYALQLPDYANRDGLIDGAKAAGIGLNVHFTPLHELAAYADPRFRLDADLPVASLAGRSIVSLPLYPCLSDESVARVIEVVGGLLDQ